MLVKELVKGIIKMFFVSVSKEGKLDHNFIFFVKNYIIRYLQP